METIPTDSKQNSRKDRSRSHDRGSHQKSRHSEQKRDNSPDSKHHSSKRSRSRSNEKSSHHKSHPSGHKENKSDHKESGSHGTTRKHDQREDEDRKNIHHKDHRGSSSERSKSPKHSKTLEKESKNTDSNKVLEAYSNVPNFKKSERKELPTFPVREYHNWIKSCLINKYNKLTFYSMSKDGIERPKISVLDLGCGKGGDVKKWDLNRGVRNYVGTDINSDSLKVIHERIKKNFPKNLYVSLIQNSADDEEKKFFKYIPKEQYFDLVSSQFVIHYLFSSKESVEKMFNNISKKLCKGGYFLCTFPDYEVITSRLEKSDTLEFGNSHYSIRFESKEIPEDQVYGLKYHFYFESAVGSKKEDSVDDVPEYLVKMKELVELASKYGLEIVEEKSFESFYRECIGIKEYKDLIDRGIFKFQSFENLSDELREFSQIYKLVAFKKTTGVQMKDVRRDFRPDGKCSIRGCRWDHPYLEMFLNNSS